MGNAGVPRLRRPDDRIIAENREKCKVMPRPGTVNPRMRRNRGKRPIAPVNLGRRFDGVDRASLAPQPLTDKSNRSTLKTP